MKVIDRLGGHIFFGEVIAADFAKKPRADGSCASFQPSPLGTSSNLPLPSLQLDGAGTRWIGSSVKTGKMT